MEQILYILIPFGLFLIIGLSFSIIYYSTKFFHLGHAVIITSGAYFVFFFISKFSIPLLLSIALAIVSTTMIGILCEVSFYRQMRKKNLPSLAYLIASMGVYIVLQNCISLYFGDDTKFINTAEITVGNEIFGAYITTTQIITIVVSITLFVSVNLFLQFTKTGKSIRAVASNPELCNIYGISSNKVILIAFGYLGQH